MVSRDLNAFSGILRDSKWVEGTLRNIQGLKDITGYEGIFRDFLKILVDFKIFLGTLRDSKDPMGYKRILWDLRRF